MPAPTTQTRRNGYPAANREKRAPTGPAPAAPIREPGLAQIASFVGFFVWLLTLKTFFLPLFIIPTGSMAESLMGAHATHACPNCGIEYEVGFRGEPELLGRWWNRLRGQPPRPRRDLQGNAEDPLFVRCPNCRWDERYSGAALADRLQPTAGDRIVVHGWPFVFGGDALGPRRWDVVVFKNPNEPAVNYIKRLIGLPGEKIEIIDGDIFVNDEIAPKTAAAQRELWFPYYNHDYRPRQPGAGGYLPRWVALGGSGWSDLEARKPRFDALEGGPAEIGFVTRTGRLNDETSVGDVVDAYGYNQQHRVDGLDVSTPNMVRDVRLSATVTIPEGTGYVELRTSKHEHTFSARLYADGRVTLEHEMIQSGDRPEARAPRTLCGEARIAPPTAPVRFALSNVDYVVSVEIDGTPRISAQPKAYAITPDIARSRARVAKAPPVLRIAASGVRATLAHVLIERDIYYTEVAIGSSSGARIPGHGVNGRPITLGTAAYFVLGDNSPASQDSRYWQAPPGPHLQAALEQGEYQLGTVPADQMIGRAFLVYWPGFLPLWPGGPNILPDLGRVRWIR